MSNELQNSLNKSNKSSTKEIKDTNPKMHQVTFQDLIIFKEDLLKELRNFRTKISNNFNNEFEKYSSLLQKANANLSIYEKDKSAYMSKVDFAEEKEKLIFELSNKDSELKNQVMINQLHISGCRKDIDDSCYKYDKIISDNLLVPGLVGKSCKFQNIREYILYNKEEINNALFANRQTGIDVNILKRKIDTISGQLTTKMKSLEYRLSNFITSKFNEINQKYERLYDELNKRMNTLTHELTANLEERNNEMARLKNFVFEENGKAIEGVNNIKEEIKKEFKAMNKENKNIKKNIVNMTNLLMGRNYLQNKQYIMNNFTNFMLEIFKELGLMGNVTIKNNESPSLDRKSSKPQATSFIKKYIEGKITVDEAKYESGGIKNKKSVKIIKDNVISSNKEIPRNINDNQKINLISKFNNNADLFEKNDLFSFSGNKQNAKNEINKKINILQFEPINKNFIKKKTTNFTNHIIKKKKESEIINEEDSNKFLSSKSLESNEKEEQKYSSSKDKKKFIKKNTLNIIGNFGSSIKKTNTQRNANEKSDNKTDIKNQVIEFSESSSSSKKIDTIEKQNNSTKNEKTITLNSKSSTIQRNGSYRKQYSNDFQITRNYTFYDKKINLEKDINNIQIEDNNNLNQIKLLNGLKTENTININVFNKSNNNLLINLNENYSKNLKLDNVEKFSYIINKEEKSSRIESSRNEGLKRHLKKNYDIKDLKDNVNKTENTNNNNNININKTDNIIINSENNLSNKMNKTENIIIKSNNNINNQINKADNTMNKTDNINKTQKYLIKADNNIIKAENIIIKTDNIKKPNNMINQLNNIKTEKEGFQIFANKTAANFNSRKNSPTPIIIKNRQIKDNKIVIDIQNNNKEKKNSSLLKYNNIAKTTYNANKNLLTKNERNHQFLNNIEENEQFSSFDKKNENITRKQLKSAKKNNQIKLKLNQTNIFKDDKDIYLTKDALKSTRYIKDEDIIDQPLIYDMNVFKFDHKKGNLENRLAELEFFTKKKLDELVKEIKIFIPIHFNSHIRNYSVNKAKNK